MEALLKKDIQTLSLEQRVGLWNKLWDSIVKDASWPVSEQEKRLLDKRYKQYKENPNAGRPWSEIYEEFKSES